MFICGFCGKEFNSKITLKPYIQILTDEKPFICDECQEKIIGVCNLNDDDERNKEVRITIGNLNDDINEEIVISNLNANEQEERNIAVGNFNADSPDYFTEEIVNVNASSHDYVKEEIIGNLDADGYKHVDENLFVCPVCQKTCKNKRALRAHLDQVHNKKRPFTCEFCDKGFRIKSCLTVHLRMHTGEKPYKCTVCEKTFISKSRLYVHNRCIHSGVKLFICEICGRQFTFYSQLAYHYVVHSDEKQFVCKDCPKTFKRQKYLDLHRRVHTGVRPYVCEVCGKAFIQKSHLTRHILGNHSEQKQGKKKFPKSAYRNTKSFSSENATKYNYIVSECEQNNKNPGESNDIEAETETSENASDSSHDKVESTETSEICAIVQKSHFTKHAIKKKIKLKDYSIPYENTKACTSENASECTQNNDNSIGKCSDTTSESPKTSENSTIVGKSNCTNHICGNHSVEFVCKDCPQVLNHQQVHTGDRPHVCEVCGKTFKQKTHCTRHMHECHSVKKQIQLNFSNIVYGRAKALSSENVPEYNDISSECTQNNEIISKSNDVAAESTQTSENASECCSQNNENCIDKCNDTTAESPKSCVNGTVVKKSHCTNHICGNHSVENNAKLKNHCTVYGSTKMCSRDNVPECNYIASECTQNNENIGTSNDNATESIKTCENATKFSDDAVKSMQASENRTGYNNIPAGIFQTSENIAKNTQNVFLLPPASVVAGSTQIIILGQLAPKIISEKQLSDSCPKKFKRRRNARRRLRTAVTSFVCVVCGKAFLKKSNFTDHTCANYSVQKAKLKQNSIPYGSIMACYSKIAPKCNYIAPECAQNIENTGKSNDNVTESIKTNENTTKSSHDGVKSMQTSENATKPSDDRVKSIKTNENATKCGDAVENTQTKGNASKSIDAVRNMQTSENSAENAQNILPLPPAPPITDNAQNGNLDPSTPKIMLYPAIYVSNYYNLCPHVSPFCPIVTSGPCQVNVPSSRQPSTQV